MIQENQILDIELRNRGNQDVRDLLACLKDADYDLRRIRSLFNQVAWDGVCHGYVMGCPISDDPAFQALSDAVTA